MTSSSRGGQRATQPTPAWQPPQRLLGDGTSVRFVEEVSGREKTFDFSRIDTEPGVQKWLARALARKVGARSGVKRVATVGRYFEILRMFASTIAAASPPVVLPGDLAAFHVNLFWERCSHLSSETRASYLNGLRSLLRDDPQISAEAWSALQRARDIRGESTVPKDAAYSDDEWQVIMTALRKDVRTARDRIRGGVDLLRRFRAGQVADQPEQDVARLLDVFDRTGDFPRARGQRWIRREVTAAGGVIRLASRLCLTLPEMTAFALLLTALTGENFGTVTSWPAVLYRPDGGGAGGPAVALVEQVKPRRGPEHEHMVVGLEDLPPELASVLASPGEEGRLFRSPLRVYELLVELTGLARRYGGGQGAFGAFTGAPGRFGTRWVTTVNATHVVRWARLNGFPNADEGAEAGKPAVNVRRIRQTVIEQRRRPVAHTRQTMNDHYLLPSPRVDAESREVVADALGEEVAKARARLTVPVFTAAFVARAEHDPAGAAAEAGLTPQVLKRLLAGEQDTVLASCTDHLAGPHTAPGTPCTASFLDCLGCPNARALPHQLPVQLAVADRITALKPHVQPALWYARYGPLLMQLSDIAAAYPPAEQETARQALTDHQRRLVDDVVEGRWDLR